MEDLFVTFIAQLCAFHTSEGFILYLQSPDYKATHINPALPE